MKKILFCASIIALATVGCSDNETDSLSKQNENNNKGVTFEGVMAEEPITRGEIRPDGNAYNFFWYAEQDRIKIWSKNTLLGNPDSAIELTDWNEDDCVIYKATQSKSEGQFTAIDDYNWLNFCNNDEKAHFFITYPSSVEATGITNNKIKLNLPSLSEQKQTGCEGQGIMGKHIFAYSLTSAKSDYDYNSVGETVNFRLTRPFTAAVFSTIGVDTYCDEGIFGNLKEITLEMCGNEDKGFESSNINYGDEACYIFDLEKCEGELEEGQTNCTNKITLELGGNEGLHWNDKHRAYMAINCVERGGIEERMEVTYEFENITLVDKDRCKTSNDWPTASNGFVTIPALNISDYTYLVTNGDADGKNRTLIINKDCELSEIYDANGKVIWEGADDGCVPVKNFREIIANDKLSSKLLASLGDFTETKKITLKENTKIPTCTFEELEDLEYIDMPKVTKIESGAFCETAELKTVLLCSYDFCEDQDLVYQEFIKKCLVTLDMSAVTDMSPAFPASGFTLAGFEDLKEVIVNNEAGVTLGASSFQGCINLEKVAGKVNLERKSVSAFEDCKQLKKIELVCEYISNFAFSGCECLEEIICGKLTYIETEAFKGTALKELDLCDAEFIGEGAFEDCKDLEGVRAKDGKNRTILYVGGENIAKDAFKGCTSLEYVHFENAKSFGSDILCGTTKLKEVKFSEVFKAKPGISYSNDTFGACGNVTLFVNPEQDCWSGRTLELNTTKLTFKSIVTEK